MKAKTAQAKLLQDTWFIQCKQITFKANNDGVLYCLSSCLYNLFQQYMQKYTDDTTQLMSEKDLLKQEYEKLKSELSNKLNASETEVSEFIEFIR